MKLKDIENVDLEYLSMKDYPALKEAMIEEYKSLPDAHWEKHHIQTLIKKFKEGQVVMKVNGKLAGCALSIWNARQSRLRLVQCRPATAWLSAPILTG